jgi:hypothetical protein
VLKEIIKISDWIDKGEEFDELKEKADVKIIL